MNIDCYSCLVIPPVILSSRSFFFFFLLQLGEKDNPAVDPIIQGLKRVVHHGQYNKKKEKGIKTLPLSAKTCITHALK